MNGLGQCTTCQVIGCKACSSTSNTECIECIDDEAQLINGECRCVYNTTFYNNSNLNSSYYLPNSFGDCEACTVKGCKLCTLDTSRCYECMDSQATLIDGLCVCPTNMKFNVKGVCELCYVQNCDSCVSNTPNVCADCLPTFAYSNGDCVCTKGLRVSTNLNVTDGSQTCVLCSPSCIDCFTDQQDEEVCS